MNNLHLRPNGTLWELAREGEEPLDCFGTKEDALEIARREMERESGSLTIHKSDGRIEEERSGPRTAHPAKKRR
jgi:hypothetical protein